MPRNLDVYLQQNLVGQLVQDHHGELNFQYADQWLNQPAAMALSHSLPLRPARYNRKACRAFFGGILPEAGNREIIAKNLGISARNDFAMLELIGGECAGAVTFMPAGQSLPDRHYHYRPLSSEALAEMLKKLPQRPLLAGEDGIRLSLAGAQDKIAVHLAGGQISLPLGGAPSTHILKPAIERFAGIVFNEAWCLQLARALGLHTVAVTTGRAQEIDYLLIPRYDRAIRSSPPGSREQLARLHQEDFCQALGIVPENKYQNEGGPSLKQCFALLRELSSAPVVDLQRFLDAVIFNFLVGNHDAHGKNFSLVYGPETRLAPLYDVLCTVYYPELSRKMAMKLGGEYDSDKISLKHFDQLAEEAALARPIVKRRVAELAEAVLANLPSLNIDHPASLAIANLVTGRCRRVLQKFPAAF